MSPENERGPAGGRASDDRIQILACACCHALQGVRDVPTCDLCQEFNAKIAAIRASFMEFYNDTLDRHVTLHEIKQARHVFDLIGLPEPEDGAA